MKRLIWVPLLLLAGCGGGGTKGPTPDPVYDNAIDAGRSAFGLARYDQAAVQYEDAYRVALRRDDAGAMADAAYDLAAARLGAGKPASTLTALDRAKTDLAIRGHGEPASLRLARAAAQLRLNDPLDARTTAAAVMSDPDAGIAERAAFLNGVAAARLGDGAGLEAALSRIGTGPKIDPLWAADRTELSARLALLRGDLAGAQRQAADAASQRQALLDYRGMRDSLGVEADAAQRAGNMMLAAALRQQVAQSAASETQAPTQSTVQIHSSGAGAD
ncbi:coiled-coil domain-containing protein [Tanticharoenia sakaeratensis]|uniref:Uncharacterized protein n=1 Tax=Tanticharoenia sakaeratensis NBRC 103193 TaxID=1231623 RepID=A0A0D6MJV5_9PROT|nr:hypothetical protein [Tanticharoenia sakaeratensis]GAN53746.1 hypothetical protein Tasa_010_293 [Tanticharoenia sakaeratensis NBRC 103193]GBQ17030.1 hypothetical protein AA103193_0193 [Tanticharoenia sakaeratensis NBRC 103193]